MLKTNEQIAPTPEALKARGVTIVADNRLLILKCDKCGRQWKRSVAGGLIHEVELDCPQCPHLGR